MAYTLRITLLFLCVPAILFSQETGALSSGLKKASKFSIPLSQTVSETIASVKSASQIDSIDRILLLWSVPEITTEKRKEKASPTDKLKVYEANAKVIASMKTLGAVYTKVQEAEEQAKGYSIIAKSSGSPSYLVSFFIGYKLSGGQTKDQRKDVMRFRHYYITGNWKKAAQLTWYWAGAPPLLAARSIRRAIENGTIVTWDAPKILMDKKSLAEKAQSYYEETIANFEKLPLSDLMKEQIKKEAEEWKIKAANMSR